MTKKYGKMHYGHPIMMIASSAARHMKQLAFSGLWNLKDEFVCLGLIYLSVNFVGQCHCI